MEKNVSSFYVLVFTDNINTVCLTIRQALNFNHIEALTLSNESLTNDEIVLSSSCNNSLMHLAPISVKKQEYCLQFKLTDGRTGPGRKVEREDVGVLCVLH